MYLYLFTGKINTDNNSDGVYSDNHDTVADIIRVKTRGFNSENRDYSFCVSDLNKEEVCGCFITTHKEDTEAILNQYLQSIHLEVTAVEISETALSELFRALNEASNNNFIRRPDEIGEKFKLNSLIHNSVDFGDSILDDDITKKGLLEKADELFSNDTLGAEIKRIYKGNKTKCPGHPVHYLVEINDKDKRREECRALLSALYNKGRIDSRRYCFADVTPGSRCRSDDLRKLYRSCIGGTIIFRFEFSNDVEDSEALDSVVQPLLSVCEEIIRYRNEVLTVLCIPSGYEKLKKRITENLGTVSLIELKEDLVDYDRGCKYLKQLSEKNNIETDEELFAEMEKGRKFTCSELNRSFNDWYNRKLKSSVYPQYSNILTSRTKTLADGEKYSAYSELNRMIGLADAKAVINKALNYFKVQKLYGDMGLNKKKFKPAMHMVFTGNPGTAKTTVARLFAEILKENDILPGGQLIEVGRKDLVGKYVGWTADIVSKAFKQAAGGVLFIDEAYSLVDDRDGMYGDEAINTIVQEMENNRDNVIVIFAGYPDKMEAFLNKNPGLRSRIAFHVHFDDYNSDELCQIAENIGLKTGVKFTEGAMNKMHSLFDDVHKFPNFGNGRYVRNVIEISRMNLASRIVEMDPDSINEKVLTTIDEQDIEVAAYGNKYSLNTRTIGFVS